MMEQGVLQGKKSPDGATLNSVQVLEKKAETLPARWATLARAPTTSRYWPVSRTTSISKAKSAASRTKLGAERDVSVIKDALEVAKNKMKTLRKALHLNASDDTEEMRKQYKEYLDLLDKKAKFDKKLAKAEQKKGDDATTVLERLEREMAELLPLLGGREKAQDVEGEIARYHKATKARKAAEEAEKAHQGGVRQCGHREGHP